MKKFTFLIGMLFMFAVASAQIPDAITIEPAGATAYDTITLKLNINKSCNTAAFDTVQNVYMHSGVNINGTAWQNVVDYNATGANGQSTALTKENDSIWSITYVPADFYDIDPGNYVMEINGVFNNGTWDVKAGDYNADSTECVDFNIPIAFSPVTIEPVDATGWQEVTITLNTAYTCPDGALDTVSAIHIHSGVTLDGSPWQNVIAFDEVGANDQSTELTPVPGSDSLWSITFVPSEFYGVEEGTIINAINMVFNNGSWDAEGKMMPPDTTMACLDITAPLIVNTNINNTKTQAFKMYPNPASDILNIAGLKDVTKVEIFNAVGQKINELEVNTKTIQVETSNLETGIYLVNFYNGSNLIATQKFMK